MCMFETAKTQADDWHEAYNGRPLRPVVCPVKAGVFSRRQSCHGKSQKPCSSDGRVKGNRYSEAHRHYHQKDDNELPGRNESKRIGGPESDCPEGRTRNRGVKTA
jgi:hypothetical protein